jgi:4-carboxymuconolactone decarboxylase
MPTEAARPTRELLALSMLVALGGADRRVAVHVASNVRVGTDRATLIAEITQLLPFVGYPRTLNALRALDDVAPATPEHRPSAPRTTTPEET